MKKLLLMLILSSCANKYVKSGGSQADFYQAKTNCQLATNAMGFNSENDMFCMSRNMYFNECVMGYGWQKERK